MKSPALLGEHRTVYSGRREAGVVMTSIRLVDRKNDNLINGINRFPLAIVAAKDENLGAEMLSIVTRRPGI